MDAVVFDLELVKRFRKGQPSEIVEIGACKVDLETKRITDQFQIYISPRSGYVSKSTRKFINMTKEDVKNAVPFPTGIQQFVNWLGDSYFLCSWGKDDRLHLINQCLRNRIQLDWFQNYNDIQQQIGKIIRPDTKSQLGLKSALELAGIEAVGKAHRGIDDAINTAELLILYLDQITLQKNSLSKKEISQFILKNRARPSYKEQRPSIATKEN
ncbi:3'-5' exonuclease [Ammoniphilus sp. CFH 90114]|uniref:3'-5' exonuclease n=1 Tax=Ammoniphilus sp. CFH 90114 TaxID=2493665 RepID=UPI0013E9558A|nr:3'-5' exonuclease [Ammoniphilus sp. CFH 90114]